MSPAGAPQDASAGPAPDTIRILALGDSYTIGEGVDPAGRWTSLLVERLRLEEVEVAEPEIVATTGWTTSDLLAGVANARPEGPFDLVTLMIGVNDQYQGLDLDGYRNRLEELLDRAVAFAGGLQSRTVVVSIPDWGVTTFARGRDREQIAREIDAFNEVARGVAGQRGVRFVDVTGLSRQAGDSADMLAADGLHPSSMQHRLWTDPIAEAVLSALR